MNDLIKYLLAIIFLILAIPIGNFLARVTKEELNQGQKWFKAIIFTSIFGSIISLFLMNDIFLFSFLFILAVTSRSLKTNKK